jgi:Tfp pilus assembly protein PilF
MWTPFGFAQEKKGCEGVGFAKRGSAQYSPKNLQERLKRNPSDVDALIHSGIRLEEQGELTQADALYERAINARPDCYLGYLFSGLVRERIGEEAFSGAESSIRKALSLNPDLRKDGNVQGFMKRHDKLLGDVSVSDKERPSHPTDYLSSANNFVIGLGVGLLLATPIIYAVRAKKSSST